MHFQEHMVRERGLRAHCPPGLDELLYDLLAELLSLLLFQDDHVVGGLAVHWSLVLEEGGELSGDHVGRVDREDASVEEAGKLLLDVELVQVAREKVDLHIGLLKALKEASGLLGLGRIRLGGPGSLQLGLLGINLSQVQSLLRLL